ncbi:xylulokinase [Salsuginibacillus kocurii]|uniref:xylulokinase n=1 Tax=Salsuginibacillus kocurii TaxID=427078 RepID=UPI000378B504|nr:xylulokinase [Salsuginibacillus kocurii]
MAYVIGLDLGTSAVKGIVINKAGEIVTEAASNLPISHPAPGYSEQNPEDWVTHTLDVLKELLSRPNVTAADIEGISFSGQMHGLVLVDEEGAPLRPAILWNDTRTTEECRLIEEIVGYEEILALAKNQPLEGFTLPKLLWVKRHEPQLYQKARTLLLPKDYVRFRLTETYHMDLSDAAGTLLTDIENMKWSEEITNRLDIDRNLLPPLVSSETQVGTLSKAIAEETGLSKDTAVFAGGADNACGAVGAGVLKEGQTMCSIGTSGVILSYESDGSKDFAGKVHYFNHAAAEAYYTMGVTLAAGYSLDWFKSTFCPDFSFEEIVEKASQVPIGANGLLFTPYLVGERSPHADADIRGSFIGMHASHTKWDFARAVLEGITFSLNESLHILKTSGKTIEQIVSIGGGAKSEEWLQMQADIFATPIVKLQNEQGPGMGAAMIAACGCGWFQSLGECAEAFVTAERTIYPNKENAERYKQLFPLYQDVYSQTAALSKQLKRFRS